METTIGEKKDNDLLAPTLETTIDENTGYQKEEIDLKSVVSNDERIINIDNVPGESIEFFTQKYEAIEEGESLSTYYRYVLKEDGTYMFIHFKWGWDLLPTSI